MTFAIVSSKGCWTCHKETNIVYAAYKRENWMTYTCSLKCNIIFMLVMRDGVAEIYGKSGAADHLIVSDKKWKSQSNPSWFEKGSIAILKSAKK